MLFSAVNVFLPIASDSVEAVRPKNAMRRTLVQYRSGKVFPHGTFHADGSVGNRQHEPSDDVKTRLIERN